MPKFPKRINIKAYPTKYGEILKLGIHKDLFSANAVEGDWLNIDILRSKTDNKPYLAINEYKKPDTQNNTIDEEITDEEIPF